MEIEFKGVPPLDSISQEKIKMWCAVHNIS